MRPVPERDQLLALTHALQSNAQSLLDDASLLYEHGRFPRAYALAALAGEELGKIYLCLDALLSRGKIDGQEFWWGWRQHGEKLVSMRAYAAAFIEDLDDLKVEQLGPDARRIGATKMSALYVDFDGHQPLLPDHVTDSEAAELLLRTRLSLRHLEGALAGLKPVVVEAAHALGPALEAFFGQVMNDRPPQEVLAELRQFVLSAPDMTVEDVMALLTAGQGGPENGTVASER